jgi:IS5 family transposase
LNCRRPGVWQSAARCFCRSVKSDGHLGRCHLKGREGDAINVILTAVGHNLRRILVWLRPLLTSMLIGIWRLAVLYPTFKTAS